MKLGVQEIAVLVAGVAAYLALLYFVHRALSGRAQVVFRYVAVGLTFAAYFIALGGLYIRPLGVAWPGIIARGIVPRDRAQDISKVLIAIAAAAGVFYEQHRAGQRRPVGERWKKFFGVMLGLCAITAYFDAWKPGSPRFFHPHDTFHYYFGARYFKELGYDNLYKCVVVAEDEAGTVAYQDPEHIGEGRNRLDLSKEVHHEDWKIRNLGGDNMLMPVTEVLEHPEVCKSHFTPERWAEFKADVLFFRLGNNKEYWSGFQHDHGYNPPPVWSIAGSWLAERHQAAYGMDLPVIGHIVWLQVLAFIDFVYLGAMFAALWWAFGWRVFAVGAIFWGCQASAPALWTNGAFLRQDWLFWLVFSTCLARKNYPALSAAAIVYSALLRIFPGLVVIGWLAVAGHQLYRHRRLTKPQMRMLLGGTLAAALLIPLSIKVAGPTSYQDFYRHTLEVHDRTPLTNHMGLRVLISQKLPFEIPALGINTGPASGRMKYVKDDKLTDAFDVWKKMRNERYAKYRPVGWAIIALSLAYFVYVLRRIKSMWIALCLGQIFIILLSQLTCYYYVFMILMAPLTKARRQLEVPLFGFAALTQFAYIVFGYFDDKFWVLTLLSLGLCYGVLCSFLSEADREAILKRLGRKPAAAES